MINNNNTNVTREKVEALLVKYLAEAMSINPTEIDRKKSFLEYGLSSISAIVMSGELSQHLNKEISPSVFINYDNIHSLTDYVYTLVDDSTLNSTPSKVTVENKPDNKLTLKKHNIIHEIAHFNKLRNDISSIGGESLYFSVAETLKTSFVNTPKTFVNFSAYNYLGFAKDKDIEKAAISAIKKYGTTVSASRVAGGDLLLHRELEEKISQFIGAEDCVIFNSGHATNVTTIGHVMNAKDLILCDELSHNSILQGAILSQATIIKFKHNDTNDLARLLKEQSEHYDKIMIIIEGLYSMDGDIPDLPAFIALKKQYACLLYIDEAHSLGILGDTGRGIMEKFHVNPNDVDFCMGTLGKAIASIGGYIAGKKELIKYLKYTTPGFVYSIGLTPSQAATALAAITKLENHPELPQTLREKARLLVTLLKAAGINCGQCIDAPVIPLIVGGSVKAIQFCSLLRTEGIFAQAIIFPAVEDNAARVRLFMNVKQSDALLKRSAKVIIKCFQQINKSI